ncbi:MAG: hypothetical protein JW976_00850 [Syntrophaceae bacterium]|nr:hypothetical protein [Syntrophaceae bacterium]
MVKFIPIKYASTKYSDITPNIQEVTCHFGVDTLKITKYIPYLSLHTDPSIDWEKYIPKAHIQKKEKILSSKVLLEFPTLFNNFKNLIDSGEHCVTILWCNNINHNHKQWSKEFAGFLIRLTEGIDHQKVKIIEVHSPFDTFCNSLENFIERYSIFEEEILKVFPSADIVIENQVNHEGKRKFGRFLLSNKDDIINISELILKAKLKLRIVLDIPQLFSEYYGNKLLSKDKIKDFLTPLKECRDLIKSTHIWGYDINKNRPHAADFNTYLDNDEDLKRCFLQEIFNLFNDGQTRYFVPEVGSTKAVKSIVNDLRKNTLGEIVQFEILND